jgi:hypothetical protein
VGLARPLLLQPFLFPSLTVDQSKPLKELYSFEENLCIAMLASMMTIEFKDTPFNSASLNNSELCNECYPGIQFITCYCHTC